MTRPRAALPFLVAAVTAAVFSPALTGGFLQWDDTSTLVDNPFWRGLSPIHLRWMLTTFHMGPWQPLSWLSYALDWTIWGLNPFGFHLTNLLLHAASAALCCLLFNELLRAGAPRSGESDRSWAAAFGALVFAIHPLRVESVAWITERRDVLSGFFYILALLLYVRRARGHGGLFPVFASFIAACLSKGSAISLPLALLVVDVWPLRRRAFREKIPFLMVALLVGLVGVAGQEHYGVLKTLAQTGIGERFALCVYGLWFGILKTVCPAGLAPYYPVPNDFGLTSPGALAAGALLLGLAAAVWRLRRRAPALPAALAFSALAAAPMLGAVRFGDQLTADRYYYLAGIGWGALASAAFVAAPRGRARIIFSAAAVACLALLSSRLACEWHDDLTLWTQGAAAYPDALVTDVNFAQALRAAGREDDAAVYERRAIAADPANADMRNNLGTWLLAKGRVPEALDQLGLAAELQPETATVTYNLGMALRAAGRREEGIDQLIRAVSLSPGYSEALNNLGLALLEDGRPGEALGRFQSALNAAPLWAVPRYNLGNALTALKRDAPAAKVYGEAIELDPKFEAAWVNGGNALARLGKFSQAVEYYERALDLSPNDATARRNFQTVSRALNATR